MTEQEKIETVPVVETEETPQETSVIEEPPKQKVRSYKALASVTYSSALERDGDVFISRFDEPLLIQSPTVTLTEDLVDDDGEYKSHIGIKIKRAHGTIFEQAERTLLENALANKHQWFGQDLDDAFIDSCFRRFYDPETRVLTVRVDDGFTSDIGKGTKVKLVLESNGPLFTKKQFGLLFVAKVVSKIENSAAQYLFDCDETLEAETVTDSGLLDAACAETL